MLRCCICKKDKPKSEFHKNSRKKRGYADRCKICRSKYQKDWYERNRVTHINNVAKRKRRLRSEWKQVRETLALKCTKCDENDPVCLDFHHVGDRELSVQEAFMWGKKKFEEELAKCSILCANCHRKVHG